MGSRGMYVPDELSHLPNAVSVRKAYKSYGTGKSLFPVLINMNMTVKLGTIYSLLGASGCGKTTLLQCILGLKKLNSGTVRVYGYAPGTDEAAVPGIRVGYMPQDLGMYLDCSIEEMLVYFGLIHGMTSDERKSRVKYLVGLLQLPEATRVIHSLSGGQRRRVSLAVALFHGGEFLVLDEPTVGLDPLLRQKIWFYLRKITAENNTTVLFTTHDTEEAKLAHMVGLMRDGHMLEQDSPTSLLLRYNCPHIEKVFLTLCIKDEKDQDETEVNSCLEAEEIQPQYEEKDEKEVGIPSCRKPSSFFHHVNAVIYKNYSRLFRMIKALLIFFILPPAIMWMFSMFIGNDPKKLKISLVNNEWPSDPFCQYDGGCHYQNLSCRYLNELDHDMIDLIPYVNEAKAVEAISRGESWGVLYFPQNYSSNIIERLTKGTQIDNKTLTNSITTLRMDMTNQEIGYVVQHMVIRSFMEFINQVLQSCSTDEVLGVAPIDLGDAIYGTNKPTFQSFMAPGMFISIVFAVSMSFSSGLLVLEKKDGVIQRSFVAGINDVKMFVAQMAVQYMIFSVQLVGMLLVMYLYQGFEINLPLFWFMLLLCCQAMCGMCAGYVLSLLASDIHILVPLIFSWMYPTILLSSTVWPLEGVSQWMRWFCLGLPTTWATEASRSLLLRGWSVLHPGVWPGFLATAIWTGVYILVTGILLRVGKKNLMM